MLRKFFNASSSVKFSGKLPIEMIWLTSNEVTYDDDNKNIYKCFYMCTFIYIYVQNKNIYYNLPTYILLACLVFWLGWNIITYDDDLWWWWSLMMVCVSRNRWLQLKMKLRNYWSFLMTMRFESIFRDVICQNQRNMSVH